MPGSREDALTPVIRLVRSCFPGRARRQSGSLLDVGCGFAKWGLLFREYLDMCYVGQDRRKWCHRIDAIDVFEPYLRPWYREIYDNVYVGEFLAASRAGQARVFGSSDVKPLADHYDLIYLGDVLEHWDDAHADQVLKQCARRSRFTLVSTPQKFKRQGTRIGNKYEDHLSHWTDQKLKTDGRAAGFKRVDVQSAGCLWIALMMR